MLKHVRKTVGLAGLSAALVFGAAGTAMAANDTINLGYTNWVGAEFNTKLAQLTIEKNFDVKVKETNAAIALQFQGVASGDIDGMLMAWLPDTHADYWKKYKDQLNDLGPVFEGAKLGWVVPDYVPKDKLSSIEDLKNADVKKKLNGIIQGIDPGAGIMRLSKETVKDYGLDDYKVRAASGPAMTAALARHIDNKKWIVVTGWTPHWMFGRFDLRFLDDPKGTLGGPQHVDILVRKGFKDDYPQINAYLKAMYIPLDTLQDYLYVAQQNADDHPDTMFEIAAKKFMEDQQDMIQKWVSAAKKAGS